jgi:hypothetical protein
LKLKQGHRTNLDLMFQLFFWSRISFKPGIFGYYIYIIQYRGILAVGQLDYCQKKYSVNNFNLTISYMRASVYDANLHIACIGISNRSNTGLHPNVPGLKFLCVVSLSTNAIVTRFYLIGVQYQTYYHLDLSIGFHQYRCWHWLPSVSKCHRLKNFVCVFPSFSTDAVVTGFLNCLNGPRLNCYSILQKIEFQLKRNLQLN